ncbi:MAG: lipocalin family protein [Pseudomonadota bacterium]
MDIIGCRFRAVALAALIGALSSAAPVRADTTVSVTPVTGFDVERYLGVWHEIASIPNWFQEDCVAATTADYGTAEGFEGITVLNSCLEDDGSRSMAEGRARFTGPTDQGGLEVTFVSLLGYWLWPLSGEYIVIAIDPEYRWTAIGHPSREYGWILAREEHLAPEALKAIETRFGQAGYDTCTLLMSPRAQGEPRTPLCELP